MKNTGVDILQSNTGQKLKRRINGIKMIKDAATGVARFAAWEYKHGRLIDLIKSRTTGKPSDISWSTLLEDAAKKVPNKPFLLYRDEKLTYSQMDQNANKIANYLLDLGCGQGKGIGIFMRNSPRFLDVFFGAQKIGMYLVPINPELKGDGLSYMMTHSDIDAVVLDAELIDAVDKISGQIEGIPHLVVNDIEEEAKDVNIPDRMKRLSKAYEMPVTNPGIGHNPDDICVIMYTSGTTGRPKGVVYRYKSSGVRFLGLSGNILLKENDIYYTYLALCHGNALFITTTFTLYRRATMALSRKFSASRFWDDIRKHNVTVFNTLGSIIPILMKQPEKPSDRDHNVRLVVSAACPAEMWEPFEKRFGINIWEFYGAIDGGGKGIINPGTAPVGSLGKPFDPRGTRVVDENGNDVHPGIPGELIFKSNGSSSVEYYKNEEASEKKNHDGWLHTGDLVKKDHDGYFYFVGRNTESMRKGGENVSAFEVEHVIMEHPAVEEVAVYAVPSELAEDEIMASVKLVDNKSLKPEELIDFLKDRLAKYAVPRYIRFVDDFPKTNTHRVIKGILEKKGVTEDTFDAKA